MLRLESLSCGYGPVRAVEGVSFELPAHSSLALLGPNGAGKTSTLMAIMGCSAIDAGRIVLDGRDITHVPAVRRVDLGVAWVPEGRLLFSRSHRGGEPHGRRLATFEGADRENRRRVYDIFPLLAERRKQASGSLSGGEQQMLAMGRALMAEPRLLLIDEMSLGLMPKMVDQCFEALETLRDEGVTILLVEQNTARALDFAEYCCVMTSGSLVFSGPSREARDNPRLFDVFINSSEERPKN